MISERVFLAFDTDGSVTCVQASGWRRAYLLWTFRNFRGLPHKTLNAQQRKLVETLYSEATSNLAEELGQERLIGTVEDLRLPSLQAATSSASEQASNIRLNHPGSGFSGLSIKKLGERLHAIYARVAFSELPRTVGAWSLVAIMALLGWQQLRSRPAVSASTAPASTGSQDANLHMTTAPSVHEPDIASAEESSGQRPVGSSQPWLAASLTSARDASAALSDMQISGPPQKVIYPDFPDKSGKVLLQAVVGSDGKVMQVRLLAGDRLLAAAARRAIRQWRYQPLLSDDRRVERETTILVAFISDDVVSVSFPPPAPISQ